MKNRNLIQIICMFTVGILIFGNVFMVKPTSAQWLVYDYDSNPWIDHTVEVPVNTRHIEIFSPGRPGFLSIKCRGNSFTSNPDLYFNHVYYDYFSDEYVWTDFSKLTRHDYPRILYKFDNEPYQIVYIEQQSTELYFGYHKKPSDKTAINSAYTFNREFIKRMMGGNILKLEMFGEEVVINLSGLTKAISPYKDLCSLEE